MMTELLELWPGLRIDAVRCSTCGKPVSQRVIVPDVAGFQGLVVRAYVECPECIETRHLDEDAATTGGALLVALKQLIAQPAVQRATYSTDIGLATAVDRARAVIATVEGA
jgi:hypothetical protein